MNIRDQGEAWRRRLSERADKGSFFTVDYVLAIRSNHHFRFIDERGLFQTAPKGIAENLSPDDWATLPAGEGTKGLRLYDWVRVNLPWTVDAGFERWLLFRRKRGEPDKLAYYLAFAPQATALVELAGAAGLRWTVEECFERAKSDLGLDHCEARSWHGWRRHMSLVTAAAAFLAKLAADLRRATWSKPNETSPAAQTNA